MQKIKNKLNEWRTMGMFENESDRRIARILFLMVSMVWLVNLLALIIYTIWWTLDTVIILSAGLVLPIFPLILLIKKQLRASSFVLVGTYIVVITILATFSGGIHDYTIMLYPIIIIFAGLVAHRAGLIFSVGLSILGLAWLVLGEIQGWFVIESTFGTEFSDLFILILLILIAARLVHLFGISPEYGIMQSWRTNETLRDKLEHKNALFENARDAIFIADPETQIILDMNASAEKLMGKPKQAYIGAHQSILHPPQTKDKVNQDFEQHAEGDGTLLESAILNAAGEIVPVEVSASLIELPNGKTVLQGIFRDVSDRKTIQEALRDSEQKLELFFAQSMDGFFFMMLDKPIEWNENANKEEALDYAFAHQRITKINDAMLEQYQAKREEFIGLTPNDLFAHDIPQGRATWMKFFNEGRLKVDTEERKFDGTPMWIEGDYICMYDKQGRIIGHFGVQRETTERKQIEENLRTNEALFRALFEQNHDAVLIMDLNRHYIMANQRASEMLGCSIEEILQMRDHDFFAQSSQNTIPRMLAGEDVPIIERILRRKDGSIFPAEINTELVRDKDGKPMHFQTLIRDISNRKQAEEALREMNSRLRLLGDNLESTALYVYAHALDGKNQFEYLSASMETLTGVPMSEALRDATTIHSTILPEYLPRLAELEEHSKQTLEPFELEVEQRHAQTGELRWMLLRSTPRRRRDGSTVWYGVQLDITERKKNETLLERANLQLSRQITEINQLQDELREQALRDPLTGLYNRRYLSDVLERGILDAQRHSIPFSIIAMDIDHFKKVNDTYGHQAGDAYLIAVANLLKHHVRGSDFVCRYGGEEFLMILHGADTAVAFRRAEEIRVQCQAMVINYKNSEMRASISLGVASYPIHAQEAEQVVLKADTALYTSKQSGRNRVTIWQKGQKIGD
jgi:diguanylate cyclase (GGDEF)-like protein/PAS domain S-box-containing protein